MTSNSSKALAVSSVLGFAACSITGYASYSLLRQQKKESAATTRRLHEIQTLYGAECAKHASTKQECAALWAKARNAEKAIAAHRREQNAIEAMHKAIAELRDSHHQSMLQIAGALGTGSKISTEVIIAGIAKLAQQYQESQASNDELESTILSLTKTNQLIEDHKEQEICEIKQQKQTLQEQIYALRAELATVTLRRAALEGRIEMELKNTAQWRLKFERQSEQMEANQREMTEMKQVLENISNETAAANEQYQELLSMQDSMKSPQNCQNSMKEQIEALDARRQALALNEESECLDDRYHKYNISNLSNLSSVYISEEMKEADMSMSTEII